MDTIDTMNTNVIESLSTRLYDTTINRVIRLKYPLTYSTMSDILESDLLDYREKRDYVESLLEIILTPSIRNYTHFHDATNIATSFVWHREKHGLSYWYNLELVLLSEFHHVSYRD